MNTDKLSLSLYNTDLTEFVTIQREAESASTNKLKLSLWFRAVTSLEKLGMAGKGRHNPAAEGASFLWLSGSMLPRQIFKISLAEIVFTGFLTLFETKSEINIIFP